MVGLCLSIVSGQISAFKSSFFCLNLLFLPVSTDLMLTSMCWLLLWWIFASFFFRRQTHSLDLTTCVAWSVYLSSAAEANWLAEFDKLHSFVFTGRLFERIRVILPKSTSRYITSPYVPCAAEGGGSGSASSNLSYLHGLGCFRFADRSCLRYKKGLCKSITGAVHHVCMATFNSHFH